MSNSTSLLTDEAAEQETDNQQSAVFEVQLCRLLVNAEQFVFVKHAPHPRESPAERQKRQRNQPRRIAGKNEEPGQDKRAIDQSREFPSWPPVAPPASPAYFCRGGVGLMSRILLPCKMAATRQPTGSEISTGARGNASRWT